MGKQKINITKETLFDLYINQNLTAGEIAERFNVNIITINRYLRKFEIKKDMSLRNAKISATKQNKTEEERALYSKHISEAREGKGLGQIPWNKGKKGVQEAWNKGLEMPNSFKAAVITGINNMTDDKKQQQKNNLSKSLTGRKPWNAGISTGPIPEELNRQRLAKQYETKKQNNSFNTSQPEEKYYEHLVARYGRENIVRQYFDATRYPFNCDFYIRPLDLFIELNLNWTHGGERFNPGEYSCRIKLADWKEKAKTSKYYKNAIETWTIRDIAKFETAERNKLNYKVYYTEEELYAK